jgi:hypothetical protein
MYAKDHVEGKETTPQQSYKLDEKGKTFGLLYQFRKRLRSTGKAIALDSGFCVLKKIVELRQQGEVAAPGSYWPKYIPGEQIKQHFEGHELGLIDALDDTLDGIHHSMCFV